MGKPGRIAPAHLRGGVDVAEAVADEKHIRILAARARLTVCEVPIRSSARTAQRSRFRPLVDGGLIGAYLAGQGMRRWLVEMRETLELRLADDLSYEETAAVLQIPVGTVRSRLHNAVKKLREEMCHE